MPIHQPLCAGTLFCLTAQALRHSYLPSLLCFRLYHIPPGAQWFMAMASNLLPTISACGGWDGVSSSQLTIGFSTDKLLRRETNLPARAYGPARGPLCNTTAKAPCCSPSVKIEDRCGPCVGFIFPRVCGRGGEGVFGVHLHAELIVYQDANNFSILRCFLFPEGSSAWLHLLLQIGVNSALLRRLRAMKHSALHFNSVCSFVPLLYIQQGQFSPTTVLLCQQLAYEAFCVATCLWTFVSCSRLFSRKEIFCFWVIYPTLSSGSIPALCQ